MFLKVILVSLYFVGCILRAQFIIEPAKRPTNPTQTPNFQGASPPEVNLKPHELSAKSHHSLTQKNSAGNLVTSSAATRPQIRVSAQERLIKDADKIVQNPEKELEVTTEEEAESEEIEDKQTHTCEEGTDPQETSFEQNLIHIQGVQQRRFFKYCQYYHAGDDAGSSWTNALDLPQQPLDWHQYLRNGHHRCNCLYNIYDFYERKVGISVTGEITPLEEWRLVTKDFQEKSLQFPERVKEHIDLKTIEDESQDEWSSLPELTGQTEQDCEVKEKVCTQGPITLNLLGKTITRSCVRFKSTYVCYSDQCNTCAQYQSRSDCHQTGSKCIQEAFGRCLKFQQTYVCVSYKKHPKRLHTKGRIPCMDGKCLKQMEWEPNQDFGIVISQLSVFSHMSKDMNAQAGHVFSGTIHRCNRECAGFKDCCKRFGGWGTDIGLSSCSAEEKLLAELRSKKRCVYVGSFCAEKVLGVCIRKKLTFCCFGSVLARLIHEQGRAQLGIGWGTAENPQCRPFHIEELTRIQFDKLNLSEITADLVAKIKTPDIGKITERFASDWKKRLPTAGDLRSSNIAQDTLNARQKEIQGKSGEYTLNQEGKKGGPDAELVF